MSWTDAVKIKKNKVKGLEVSAQLELKLPWPVLHGTVNLKTEAKPAASLLEC